MGDRHRITGNGGSGIGGVLEREGIAVIDSLYGESESLLYITHHNEAMECDQWNASKLFRVMAGQARFIYQVKEKSEQGARWSAVKASFAASTSPHQLLIQELYLHGELGEVTPMRRCVKDYDGKSTKGLGRLITLASGYPGWGGLTGPEKGRVLKAVKASSMLLPALNAVLDQEQESPNASSCKD